MKKLLLLLCLFCGLSATHTQAQEVLKDTVVGKKTLTADKIWTLEGFVYVVDGAELTIEAGTVIKGDKATKGTLVIERGGKIFAQGTAQLPIVFTSSEAVGARAAGDWGGVVICGRAPVNQNNADNSGQFSGGEAQAEGGIRSKYGGNRPDDNSGVFSYVRIEFAGIALAPNNELNGLTMAGVGRLTKIDHVQISFGGDDAFEWFGGTVNAKHLISYRTLDDCFDTDLGYSGNIQFAVNVSDPTIADVSGSNGFESDNDASGSYNKPRTKAVFSNVTNVGPLADGVAPSAVNSLYRNAVHIRRSSQLNLFNSVFMGWTAGILMDGVGTTNSTTNDSLEVKNNILAGIPAGAEYKVAGSGVTFDTKAWWENAAHGNRTLITNAEVGLAAPFNLPAPNWRPSAGSPAATGASFTNPKLPNSFFTPTSYVGAFDPAGPRWDSLWASYDPNAFVYNAKVVKDTLFPQSRNVDFGLVGMGESVENNIITITCAGTIGSNGTGGLLNLSNFAISGPNASEFQLVGASDVSLNPGQNVKIKIKFTPSGTGDKTATLTYNHNSTSRPSPASFNLRGTGITPFPGDGIVEGSIKDTKTLTNDREWLIKGFVNVEDGGVLQVQPGTVVRGEKATNGTIIVERGGIIYAEGTASHPIVFTSQRGPGERSNGDWGGIIICGKAPINPTGGDAQIEGGPRSRYGGTDPNDSSGVLRYVRIEFSGIPLSPNNETNTLTMGGVGNRTVIDHVQASYGGDDGFEWFGGTVNAKHLITQAMVDDCFDTDFGYSGKVQFVVNISDPALADLSRSNGFESDNDASGTFRTPRTSGVFSNVTLVGPLADGAAPGTVNSLYGNALHIRRASQLNIFNSIFMGWPGGILMDGNATVNSTTNDTLNLKNNILAGIPAGQEFKQTVSGGNPFMTQAWFENPSNSNRKLTTNADVNLEAPFALNAPNFTPKAGSPAETGASFTNPRVADSWFTPTTYVGAFDPAAPRWDAGWSDYDAKNTVYIRKAELGAASLDLGDVEVTKSKNQTFTAVITNTGNLGLRISRFQVTGANAAEFTVVSPAAPFTLLQGESRDIEIRFAPTAGGQRTANLVISHNEVENGSVTATLTGNGVTAGVSDVRSLTGVVLSQSVPNPSRENAMIAFELPKTSFVTLEVFDMTGRIVATLANGMMSEGAHETMLNTSSLSEGVYVYRLTANGETLVKNMIVIH